MLAGAENFSLKETYGCIFKKKKSHAKLVWWQKPKESYDTVERDVWDLDFRLAQQISIHAAKGILVSPAPLRSSRTCWIKRASYLVLHAFFRNSAKSE